MHLLTESFALSAPGLRTGSSSCVAIRYRGAGSVVEADNRAKYVAFKDLVGPAKEMFDELFKVNETDPNVINLEPDP